MTTARQASLASRQSVTLKKYETAVPVIWTSATTAPLMPPSVGPEARKTHDDGATSIAGQSSVGHSEEVRDGRAGDLDVGHDGATHATECGTRGAKDT